MHDIQVRLTQHLPTITSGGRSATLAVLAAVLVIVALALVLERQRPLRRVARARHPETIPTWGDLYLESMAENYRKAQRFHRGRISAP